LGTEVFDLACDLWLGLMCLGNDGRQYGDMGYSSIWFRGF